MFYTACQAPRLFDALRAAFFMPERLSACNLSEKGYNHIWEGRRKSPPAALATEN